MRSLVLRCFPKMLFSLYSPVVQREINRTTVASRHFPGFPRLEFSKGGKRLGMCLAGVEDSAVGQPGDTEDDFRECIVGPIFRGMFVF